MGFGWFGWVLDGLGGCWVVWVGFGWFGWVLGGLGGCWVVEKGDGVYEWWLMVGVKAVEKVDRCYYSQ